MLSPWPRLVRAGVCAVVALLLAGAGMGAAQYGGPRAAGFARAERMREALEGRPEQDRTRLQYERVLNAYRAIYHGDPASPKADASIAAVAELLAEEGRIFQDDKALDDAIGQYEFLRHQYPGSRYRFSALLTEGEIYQRDLGEQEHARAVYESFLRLYPRNPLAVEARAELKKMRREEAASGRTAGRQEKGASGAAENAAAGGGGARRGTGSKTAGIEESDLAAPGSETGGDSESGRRANGEDSGNDYAVVGDEARMNAPPPPRRGGLTLITGIRHWSAPNYTRVVVDLEKVVRYQAARVPGTDGRGDQIFFDLYGTRLSPVLEGRSVEVTDEGFLTRIRAAQPYSNLTRIVLDVNGVSDYSAFFLRGPPRLVIDVHGRPREAPPREIASAGRAPVRNVGEAARKNSAGNAAPNNAGAEEGGGEDSGALTDADTLGGQPDTVRATRHPTTGPVVAGTARPAGPFAERSDADDVPPANAGAPGIPAPPPAGEHVPNSMMRTLGLKINRIVIDAGHGGHDSGTIGPGGLEEKDVVLDVALRLGRLLRQRLGADVIYTRTDDTFVPLETRTAIANQAQADLFISIHANSSSDTDARGVEVYYLNFTTSADALEVAARENAASDRSIHQLSDLVKKIALDDKINESRAFATDVDESLYAGLERGNPGLKDRGVKKAPFVVLIGANMPSILAEISFLTNPESATELREPAYRQRIAEALYRGVARYVSSLNGVRVAQAGGRTGSTE